MSLRQFTIRLTLEKHSTFFKELKLIHKGRAIAKMTEGNSARRSRGEMLAKSLSIWNQFLLSFFFLLIYIPILSCSNPIVTRNQPIQGIGTKYMISTDHPLATKAGLEVLEKGGNLFDAFVAASFAISVVRPQSTGLMGGGFAVLYRKQFYAFDFRERAPQLAQSKMYLDANGKPTQNSLKGFLSIAVPGNVKGLALIHKRFGKLPFSDVLAPSLRYARDGFEVYGDLESAVRSAWKDFNPEAKQIFKSPTSESMEKPISSGEILVQKDLAETISSIQKTYGECFYSGNVARIISTEVEKEKGILRKNDLVSYKVNEVKPIFLNWENMRLATMPLPSSGVFLFQMLKASSDKNWIQDEKEDPKNFYLGLVTIMKNAYANRWKYGSDPKFSGIDTNSLLKDKVNTTHISLLDSEGNGISSTQSINYSFGSRVVIPKTGLVANDTMDDFSVAVGVPNAYGLVGTEINAIAPNKTPLSSMSPIVGVQNGKSVLAIGAPGGSEIPTSIYQTLINYFLLNYDLAESVSRKRLHHQYKPETVFGEFNPGFSYEKRGSRAKVFAVIRKDEKLIGVVDPRGQGSAEGK